MPVPVIDDTQSVQGWLQYEQFEFQLFATNTPTSWAATPLPTGVSFNTSTGKFSGAGTVPGVTSCSVTATNGSGTSSAVIFTFGIEENSQVMTEAPAFAFDLQTGAVNPTSGPPPLAGKPLFWLKANDLQPILLQFYNYAAFVDFNPSSLKFILKEFEPETGVLTGGGVTLNTHFQKIGAGANATWVIVLDASAANLISALTNYESDTGTFFYALAEIEVKYPNPFVIGATPLVRSSRLFVVGAERDLVP